MRRASGVVMADLAAALDDLDLKIGVASILILIGDSPGSTQSTIGRRLGIQRANMAPLIAQLVQRELVERTPSDGRSAGLHLTAAGSKLVAEVRKRIIAHEDRVFASLGPAERESLRVLLSKVRTQSEAADEP